MRRVLLAALLAASLPVTGGGAAEEAHHHHHGSAVPPRPDCPAGDTSLRCATTATPAFTPDGTLVLAWTAGGRVMVGRSGDLGATPMTGVAVNPDREPIDDSGESRAAVIADGAGSVLVAYSRHQDQPYSGTLMVAYSGDGGRHFAHPVLLANDPASQRFPALTGDGRGRVALAWIDKRSLAAAKRAGRSYAGAALAATVSTDGGATFRPERVISEHTCECCRIAAASDPAGHAVLMWRQLFDGARDPAVTTLDGRDNPHRVAADNWRVDACPHHGGAVAVGPGGTLHVAWYTGGTARPGLFYARSTDRGRHFGEPRPLGDPGRLPSHPQLLAAGGRVWLAWSEFDGETTRILAQSSTDGGLSWSPPHAVAETKDASDRPLLVADGPHPFLSWLTRNEGWRLLPLAGDQP
ncbi:MAG: sialidase family protein [Magnetospirillum sp.]|nr:sialidase family protein [Magnetospirillum sp.]